MTLEQRIGRLERSAFRWRLATFLLLLIILAGATATTKNSAFQNDSIECKKLVVHGPIDTETLLVSSNGGKSNFVLGTTDEAALMSMGSGDDGRIQLTAGKEGAVLTLAGVKDFPHKMMLDVTKECAFMLLDTLKRPTVAIGTDPTGGQIEAHEMDGTGYALRGNGVSPTTSPISQP